MKALIRNEGETVRETDGIEGIDWTTGAPLTNKDWCGGSYTLVDNYVEPEPEPEVQLMANNITEIPVEDTTETVEEEIEVNGIKYKRV